MKRRLGYVEKLLNSFGFIQTVDDAVPNSTAGNQGSNQNQRLFFHYSHFLGNAQELRIHDEVEFEVIVDRDNRRVATRVTKLKKGIT